MRSRMTVIVLINAARLNRSMQPYPTGIEGILARAGSDVTQRVAENAQGVTQVVSQLAAKHLSPPVQSGAKQSA